jgi:dTDP-4-amino-4,6-dideoxygalactose transaminase
MSEWHIALSDLAYGAEEQAAAMRVIESKWLSMGPQVRAFEEEFATMVGSRHALGVASGTAALHLAYLALGLGPGDEVIQPAINFVAAANLTVAVGAEPVFADIIGPDEPTIDPAAVERQITPHTRAVVVMHYGGYLCRMAELRELCQRSNLALIEDACHAVGARYLDAQQRPPHHQMAGNLSDIACFSFFSNKNLATGEGGMVVTSDDGLAEQLRLLRSHGMSSLTWERHRGHASSYDVTLHGYNYRLDELRAALGRVQLSKLARHNQVRGQLVAAYRRHLKTLPGWVLPFANYQGDSAYHLMVAVAPDEATRSEVVQALREARIQSSMHYPCIPEFTAFERYQTSAVPHSQAFARRAITLPLFPTMTEAQVAEVCTCIRTSIT